MDVPHERLLMPLLGTASNGASQLCDKANFGQILISPRMLKPLSIQPSVRSKAVVDAELHCLDGLLNVNPWHHFGEASNRPRQ